LFAFCHSEGSYPASVDKVARFQVLQIVVKVFGKAKEDKSVSFIMNYLHEFCIFKSASDVGLEECGHGYYDKIL
jgi:hypothetical protein